MGWSFTVTKKTNKEVILSEVSSSEKCEILEVSLKGNVGYVLLRNKETQLSWIEVVLIQRRNGEVGTKWMEESMQPYYYDCPLKFLKLASSATSEGAQKWRELVIEKHNKNKQSKTLISTLKTGQVIGNYFFIGKEKSRLIVSDKNGQRYHMSEKIASRLLQANG